MIATGRMFRSVRPYAEAVGIEAPLVCYQGAAVVDPVTGEWLLHEPIPLELAREAIAAVEDEGFALNCYVDDELYVASDHRARARLRRLPEHPDPRGRRPARLARAAADEARRRRRPGAARRSSGPACEQRFGERLFIAKSLPYFLELAEPGDLEGERARVRRRARRLHARSARSRSATARTTSSSSTGPASASRSRTRTTGSRPAPTGSAPRPRRRASRRCSRRS